MIVLESHIVPELSEKVRFVDYAIGLFKGFETRSAVKKAIKKRRFSVQGERAETGTWIRGGERIDLRERQIIPKAYDRDIEIVFEDDFLAIVNKPAGLIVSGNQFKTLENCLVDQVQKSSQEDALDWALPVHRLDAPTSGLVIFAKTIGARRALGEMLKAKSISKKYHAIVHGIPENGDINLDIESKAARSRLSNLQSTPSLLNGHLSLVRLEPITGRTHQLRIHCKSIGHAIVGDQLYENEAGTFRNKGLFLAATELSFSHPITKEQVEVSIPIPHKFQSLLEREEKRAKRYQKD
ncbi:MAG: RluA family pseudouridine synthase [Crocinitomicaceae bacterium]